MAALELAAGDNWRKIAISPATARQRIYEIASKKPIDLGGSFTLPGTSMSLNRLGCGAIQLAGPEVWGPLRDVDGAVAVLREAVASGVNHIDTSDYYNLIGDMRAGGAEGNRPNHRDRA